MNTLVKVMPISIIDLLKLDHLKTTNAFSYFDTLGDLDFKTKNKVVKQICLDLMAHLAAEEEILYPIISQKIKNGPALIDESIAEHGGAKELITKLQHMNSREPLYDGTVKILEEIIYYHVEEEENYIFPLLEQTNADLEELGRVFQINKKAHN